MQDPEYLRSVHYRDSSRLNARIELWKRYSKGQGAGVADWIFEPGTIPENADVLEVGCGTGHFWINDLHRVPARWRITLSDVSPGMVEECKAGLGGASRSFSFQVIDASSIPFENNSFDLVIASYMLYHVPDVDSALVEISRVLRSGGVLIASTNSEQHIAEIREIQTRFGPGGSAADSVNRLNSFSMETGEAQLRKRFGDVAALNDSEVLAVEDAEIVVSYVLSLDGEFDESAVRNHVENQIVKTGAFSVTRSTGFFVATKPQ